MRIFLTKEFNRFARKESVADNALVGLVADMEQGLGVTPLGGDLYKMRLARPGGGKSGGYRIIICTKKQDKLFFLYGYAKSDQENLTKGDDMRLKMIAEDFLGADDTKIERAINAEELKELDHDEKI